MAFTTLFFDLDDTLYPASSGLWEAIRTRMDEYLHLRMGFSPTEIPALRRYFYRTYGTTLRGLQATHAVDSDEFLAYVHDIPVERYLKPDPDLRRLLLSLPQKRWVFTNADAAHASRVLCALELEGCFEGIIDIRAVEFQSKPDVAAYRKALEIAREADPGRCAIFDDAARNLAGAKQAGLFTVLVGSGEAPDAAPDLQIESLLDLPRQFPALWL